MVDLRPPYAGDSKVIGRMWDLAQPKHGGCVLGGVERGWGQNQNNEQTMPRGLNVLRCHLTPTPTPRARDWRSRLDEHPPHIAPPPPSGFVHR